LNLNLFNFPDCQNAGWNAQLVRRKDNDGKEATGICIYNSFEKMLFPRQFLMSMTTE